MKTILISSHTKYVDQWKAVYGPTDSIINYLKWNEIPFTEVRHCLDLEKNTEIIIQEKTIHSYDIAGWNMFFKIFRQLKKEFVYFKNKWEKYEIYIWVNLINSFLWIFLKRSWIIKKNIYFCVDYTENRYKNKIVNFVYSTIDKISLKYCDEVWCVSSRIVDKRRQQWKDSSKVILLPNSPIFAEMPRKENTYESNYIILVSNLTNKWLIFEPVLEWIKNTSLDLKVVWDWEERPYYEWLVNKHWLEKRVSFLWVKPHNEALELISSSFAGVALYNWENTWNIYWDSMKAREYVAMGVPCIINSIPSTADDIKNFEAWLCIDDNYSVYISDFINKCKSDKSFYETIKQNCINMWQKYDKNEILKKLI